MMLVTLPLTSHSVISVYTVQTGSFSDLASAEKQFNLLKQGLQDGTYDSLRIEKIGKFYSVRLGRFNGQSPADKMLSAVKKHIGNAIVMKAYYKEERIIKLHPEPVIARDTPQEIKKEVKQETAAPEISKPEKIKKAATETGEKRKPGSLKELIKMVSILVQKEDYEEAEKTLSAEIKSQPENPEINGWYGTVLLKMNNPSGALKYFIKASELSPNVPEYHNGSGYCLFYLNRFNEALDKFKEAESLHHDNIDAVTGLGLTYAKLGNKHDAMEAHSKLKDLDKDTAATLLKIIETSSF
jgi:tetratricopeptide (TPR) repeat protein